MATVKIPPVLRPSTSGEKEVSAGGATVGQVLGSLAEDHPATRSQIFGDGGELNRYVNVYLNDEDVRVLQGLETEVGESDVLVILPAMAGGAIDFVDRQRELRSRASLTSAGCGLPAGH
ncbi:MAG: MoaD/ThiS family protein [Actinobacteria bacterium]|nr:MAG: MoaD/ThiS family protein [Actinomycetota bacterium]